jgi:hypothetical protein
LDSQLHTRIQAAVKTVDRRRLFSTKEDMVGPSAGNVMVSVFWDAEGILYIDYFEKDKTITGEYYSNLLTRLNKKNREKRPGLQKEKNHLSSEQCTRPQTCFGNGKIKGSAL